MILFAVASGVVLFSLPAQAGQESAKSFEQLETMVKGLAYETKLVSKEGENQVGEFKVTKGDLNVFVTFETSPSKRFIWLTTFCGKLKADATADQFKGLLRLNAAIQPAQAYLTKDEGVKFAVALENRDLTPALLKWGIDKVVDSTVDNKTAWLPMVAE
jgi:hypothetical protein